jgi:tyrosyl-tRNA synthetase
MSKSKGNYIAIADPPNDMFAKIMSISDDLMWKYFDLLSNRSVDEIGRMRAESLGGGNPRDAKVALAKEITARFHGAGAAERGEADFNLRARGGVPDEIEAVALQGAPLGIGAVLKQARLAPSTSEAMRLLEGGGVRIDGAVVSDRALKLPAGTFVVQVGKRKFARVTLS